MEENPTFKDAETPVRVLRAHNLEDGDGNVETRDFSVLPLHMATSSDQEGSGVSPPYLRSLGAVVRRRRWFCLRRQCGFSYFFTCSLFEDTSTGLNRKDLCIGWLDA